MSRAPTDAVVSLAVMNAINAAVLKMVLDSPVGRSMSDGDRAALTQTLTTTDPREVQGWLGEQIRKAARAVVKGDYDGHPFRGNQWSDASGSSTGGAGAAGSGSGEPRRRGKDIDDLSRADQKEFADRMSAAKTYAETREIIAEFKTRLADGSPSPSDGSPKGNAKMSGKAKVDTMFSDGDNKKVATAFTAWVKSQKFPADHQITSKEINEFADSMEGKVGSEVNDTAVREQLAEQYHEQTGIPYKARQARQDRDDSNRAKREALQEKRTQQARAAAEERQTAETERLGKLKPIGDDIGKKLPAAEAKQFAAGVKATRRAVERTDGVIAKLKRQWSEKFGSNPRSQEAQDAAAAIEEAQEVTDRIREMVGNIGDRASFGNALRLTQMGANEAETAKGALQEAQDFVAPSRERRIGGGVTFTKPQSAAAESRDIKDVYSLQDAMDRDFGVDRDKYDVDGVDFDKVFEIGR